MAYNLGSVANSAFGCPHYKRNCKIVAPCCNGQAYYCRFCHDENVKDGHILNQTIVEHVICCGCNKKQLASQRCTNCSILFGQYFCAICKLYDMDISKGQFHCPACGICRTGGEDNSFHCPKCNACFSINMIDNHVCIENVSRAECSLCLEFLHTSRGAIYIPPKCGHWIHEECYKLLKNKGNNKCPQCQKPW